SHKRTLEGMKQLQRHGVEYGINCCLNKKNLNRIQDIVDLAAEYGAARIAFLDLKPIGRMRSNNEWLPTNSEYEIALKKLFIARAKNPKIEVSVDAYLHCYPMQESAALAKKGVVSCRAGISRLSIGSDGAVYPCNLVVGNPHWAIGNIKETSLEQIWFSPKWYFFRGQTKLSDLKVCGDCRDRKSCLDFYCRLLPYAASGDLYGAQLKCNK
ncbi:MAG TPA: radical SAM protein, partial [Oculatellaceae cyanobacterium]